MQAIVDDTESRWRVTIDGITTEYGPSVIRWLTPEMVQVLQSADAIVDQYGDKQVLKEANGRFVVTYP